MYQIQLRTLRADVSTAKALPDNQSGQDAMTAFAIAADADAYATRLMDCADARLSLARNAYGAHPPTMLNQAARALALIERAGEAKRFSELMLGCAICFERVVYFGNLKSPESEGEFMAALDEAQITWNMLMSEGIFGQEMYS